MRPSPTHLQVGLRVPVGVEQHHSVGSGEIDPHSACPCAQQEHERIRGSRSRSCRRRGLEPADGLPALLATKAINQTTAGMQSIACKQAPHNSTRHSVETCEQNHPGVRTTSVDTSSSPVVCPTLTSTAKIVAPFDRAHAAVAVA